MNSSMNGKFRTRYVSRANGPLSRIPALPLVAR